MAGLEHAVRHLIARPRLALTVWGTVIVLLAAGVGVLWWQDRQHDEAGAAGVAAVDVAERSVKAVLSYRAASVDSDLTAAERLLTGDFRDDFGKLADSVVGPAAKQDGVSTDAKVVASSVVSATLTDVVALVYVTQSTESKTQSEPKITGSRLRVLLTLVGGRWLVNDLKPL